jgi:hypothetical protein
LFEVIAICQSGSDQGPRIAFFAIDGVKAACEVLLKRCHAGEAVVHRGPTAKHDCRIA